MKKMDPVVHFEMPAEDIKRVSGFYSEAFGWQMNLLGEEMGNYATAYTSDTDKNGRPKSAGMINGGFFPKKDDMPAQFPSVVISVDDLKASMKKVEKAGGKIIGEPMPIPGIGSYVSFYDTENNRVGLLQPIMM